MSYLENHKTTNDFQGAHKQLYIKLILKELITLVYFHTSGINLLPFECQLISFKSRAL